MPNYNGDLTLAFTYTELEGHLAAREKHHVERAKANEAEAKRMDKEAVRSRRVLKVEAPPPGFENSTARMQGGALEHNAESLRANARHHRKLAATMALYRKHLPGLTVHHLNLGACAALELLP